MNSAQELSIGFLKVHPEGAALVLEAIDPEDAAAYLKEVPDTIGGRALTLIQPLVAAAILSNLTRKKSADILLTMDVQGRSRVLRLLDDNLTKSIMSQMPKGAARDLLRFLNYPEGSVGAWMSSDVAVFDKSVSVRDCIAKLRSLPGEIKSLVFIVDSQHRLHGAVDLADLLVAADDTGIDTLVDTGIRRLSPYARLSSAVALTAWDAALLLPVVDTKGKLLGALRFDRLREGLAAEHRSGTDGKMASLLVHMAEALLVCAAGVLQGTTAKPILSRSVSKQEN